MKIKTQDYNDVTVIELHGEFSSEFIKPFQDTASSVIASGAAGIVLDMSKTGFIDSQGLEHLVWMRDYCSENTRQFKVAGLDENCKLILEITRLDKQFDIYGELSEAVKSFV